MPKTTGYSEKKIMICAGKEYRRGQQVMFIFNIHLKNKSKDTNLKPEF